MSGSGLEAHVPSDLVSETFRIAEIMSRVKCVSV